MVLQEGVNRFKTVSVDDVDVRMLHSHKICYGLMYSATQGGSLLLDEVEE